MSERRTIRGESEADHPGISPVHVCVHLFGGPRGPTSAIALIMSVCPWIDPRRSRPRSYPGSQDLDSRSTFPSLSTRVA
jgi:hypothetical protein